MSLGNIGQKKEACLTFSQLAHDFPKASEQRHRTGGAGEAALRLLMRAVPPGRRAAAPAVTASEAAAPLSAAEFAVLMAPLGPFEIIPLLAVAVSGGADSLALCSAGRMAGRLERGGAVVGSHRRSRTARRGRRRKRHAGSPRGWRHAGIAHQFVT